MLLHRYILLVVALFGLGIPAHYLFSAPVKAQDSSSVSYVGVEFERGSLPGSLTPLRQGLIDATEYPGRGITVVHDGTTWRIWLQRVTEYGDRGPAAWQILDEVVLEGVVSPDELLYHGGCTFDGEHVRSLVAIGTYSEQGGPAAIRSAWLADGEVLRALPRERVHCGEVGG